MERFSLFQIKIIFIAASVLLISLSVFSYFRLNNLLQSSSMLNHTNIVKLELESIFSRIKDADSEQRGFVLTKDTIYISQFKKTIANIRQRQEKLKELTLDNYSQRRNIEVLNQLIEKRIVHMEAVLKDVSQLPALKITTERWLQARAIMLELRKQTDKMVNEEHFLLRMRTKSLVKETALNPLFTVLLIMGSTLILILSYYAVNKELKISNNLKSDLEEKNESLALMNKELESFTYISSHDLQEPLRKIQMFITRIMDNEYQNLSENSKTYLNKTSESANRMQMLIRDLLAYSKLKTEIFPIEKTNLKLIVDEVSSNLEEEISEENATIIVKGSPDVDIIVSQFRQLLTNLISNSIKFASTERPLLITIENTIVKGSEIGEKNFPTELDFSKITVSDNGIGFEAEYKDRIFEVFQRVHSDWNYKGTGIGLAIVKKIVENHEGFIIADGKVNQGAVFTIYLPVQTNAVT